MDDTDEVRDGRLRDVQRTVHIIDGRVTSQEHRLGEVETRVIKVEAKQELFEKLMHSEHARLHEKMDVVASTQERLFATFHEHVQVEDGDRRKLFWMMVTILLSVAGYFGVLGLEHILGME